MIGGIFHRASNSKATPIYVLSVWTNDADDQADALTAALRSRVRQLPGWSLAETTQSFETLAIAGRPFRRNRRTQAHQNNV